MAKHFADIARSLAIAGNAACTLNGAGTCIVGSYREVDHAKPVEHLPQVSRCAEDVGHWIEAIEDPKLLCRSGHQLAKARGTRRADSQRIVTRFCPYERIKQARGQ